MEILLLLVTIAALAYAADCRREADWCRWRLRRVRGRGR